MKSVELCGFPYGAEKVIEAACVALGCKVSSIDPSEIERAKAPILFIWASIVSPDMAVPLARTCVYVYDEITIDYNKMIALRDRGFKSFLYMGLPLNAKKVLIDSLLEDTKKKEGYSWLSRTESMVYDIIKGNFYGVDIEDVCLKVYGSTHYSKVRSTHKHISNINKKIKQNHRAEIIDNVGEGKYQWKLVELSTIGRG